MARRDRPFPLITPRDIALTLYLAVLLLVSWALPERSLERACAGLARMNWRVRPRRHRRLTERIASLLGTSIDEAAPLVNEIRKNVHLRHAFYLRALRPGGWSPVIRLEGQERIDTAMAGGSGVILWVSPMLFSDLVTKMTLARAGFRISHISLYVHGFSSTRFGFRFLNQFATRAEERFLAERLVITRERRLDAIRELTRRVRNGDLVSMSAVVGRGQRSVSAPFLRGGRIRLAVGPAQFMRRTGAAILPVFTVRLEDGSFCTTVEEPIQPPAGELDRDASAEAVVAAYTTVLERYVRRWPAQYPAFGPARGLARRAP